MTTAVELQREINRFASSVGFVPIACDGDPGALTLEAALMALMSISLVSPDQAEAAVAREWIQKLETLAKPADIMQHAFGVMANIRAGADSLGLSAGTCGSASVSKKLQTTNVAAQTALANQRKRTPALSAGILGLGLPDWAVIGGGAALLIAVVMLIKTKKAGASSAVTVSGRRY